ncbi:MBL fold metallo-hydrolase [Vibrio sp. SG41-7]|uniref:ComEC/Rec2 family competence protein n=1 Tax=Vibrio sp. SG41-7 TaxID=2760973 RepID=UPI001600B97F|nr:MBL fold metallo-hydrolase [Vibrio sp. SG41-7]MBB1466198.1 MBL fold metallo-hydrolase [Vibrio sp. SG41-7]
MEFISFGALQGDSFIVKSNSTNILIDGGMPSTYGQIREHLDHNGIDAIFITHVDYDHLGGIFNLVNDEELDLTSYQLFMNHPEFPSEYQGEEVGFKHGHSLKGVLEQRGKSFNQVTTNQELTFGNINVVVLSPDEVTVELLYESWESNIIYEDGILKYKKQQTQSGDIINKSSLILLLSCNGSNILMLGDSHAESACTSIKNRGYSAESPLPLNLLKLSHHGSSHNTNEELLALVDCTNYYISTNGGRYNHPDAETIQLLQERAAELGTSFTIYLNYDIEDDIRQRCNFPTSNLLFIEQCSLEYS